MNKTEMAAEIGKPRKVALYMNLNAPSSLTVWEVPYVAWDERYAPLPAGQTRERPRNSYVRVSDPLEVGFTPVDDDSMVRNAVSSLDEQERALLDELNRKLADIKERRNQLLALTYQADES